MAERIDWKKIDINDPRFLEADLGNTNVNISASRFDPTDPTADVGNPDSASAKYNQFLQTANIGDTFDFGGGISNKFVGFNKMGTPTIQTIQSDARTNWRDTMSGSTTEAEAVNKLKDAGFDSQMAKFLVRQSGTGFISGPAPTANKIVTATKKNTDGTTTVTYSDNTTATLPAGTAVPVVGSSLTTSSVAEKTLVSTDIDDNTGDTIGYFSDGSKLVLNKGTGPVQSAEFKDAYALLSQTFRDYGLESLVPAIEGLMKRNVGPKQAGIEIRTMPEYIARFKGNDLRRAAGKNAVSEAEYLAIEDAYDQTLRAYGQQNYFGIDRKSKQEKAAELIGNDISAVEFKDRIQLAVDRVQNADPVIKSTLKQFYPNLNESDLVGYFLNPKDNLPKLQEKVTASEIGAAATGLNLATDVATATDLAKYGVTQAQAREGYSGISAVLPTAKKLGDIYGETGVKYAQKEAEAEVFKGNQDAATKRKRLASMERAAFSGSSGTGQSSLSKSTQGLL
jgi:hypothetical protein